MSMIIELLFGAFFGVIGTLLTIKHLIKKVEPAKEEPLNDSEFDPLEVIKKAKEESAQKDNTIRETINASIKIKEENKDLKEAEKRFKELMVLKSSGAEMSEIIWTMNKFQREIEEKEKEEKARNNSFAGWGSVSGYMVTGSIYPPKEKTIEDISGEFFAEEQKLESE
jgi:hypothetical protein